MPREHQYYKQMTSMKFKEIVKKKSREYAFKKLMKMKNNHTKMKRVKYEKLGMQSYLTSKDLTREEKITVLHWRVHMEQFGENYRGKKEEVICPLCGEHKDDEESSFSVCKVTKKEMNIEGNYESLFEKDVDIISAKTACKISALRKRYLEDKE